MNCAVLFSRSAISAAVRCTAWEHLEGCSHLYALPLPGMAATCASVAGLKAAMHCEPRPPVLWPSLGSLQLVHLLVPMRTLMRSLDASPTLGFLAAPEEAPAAVRLRLGHSSDLVRFYIADLADDWDLISGQSWLKPHCVVIDYSNDAIVFWTVNSNISWRLHSASLDRMPLSSP